MVCTHIKTCALFPQLSLNSALKVWQVFYCEGHFDRCSRYQLACEGKPVPITLLPNGKNMIGGSEKDNATVGTCGAATPPPIPSTQAPAAKQPAPAAQAKIHSPANDPVHAPGSVAAQAGSAVPATAPAPAVQAQVAEGTSYYLRIQANMHSDTLTELMRILGDQHIEIEALIQKKSSSSNKPASIIILTPPVSTNDMTAAIQRLRTLDSIVGNVTCIPLERLPQE